MTLPEGFKTEFDGLEEGLLLPPSVSVRVNRTKGVTAPQGRDIVAWCPDGFYLDSRVPFTFDPAMHQGLYYVQDASSMIYSHIVGKISAGMERPVYLDSCAAPGGKTTAAIDALPEGSTVVANEYVFPRAEILAENLIKWGYPRCIVTRGDTSRFRKTKEMFDIIAADVPCSGEGMFRKDPEAVKQWSPALVEECAARQREIVDNLWPALKPGGYLIYSTCTFNRRENEDIAAYILDNHDAEPADPGFPEPWGIAACGNCRHFLPGRIRGEGLTVALFRKKGELTHAAEPGRKAAKKGKNREKTTAVPDEISRWTTNPEDMRIVAEGDKIIAIPSSPVTDTLCNVCDVIYKGVEIAGIKGRDIIPSHALAMSRLLVPEAFPQADVDFSTAIKYLRRETIILEDAPRGFVLLNYKGRPLGFIKNLGNRANNLYPPNWRILSTHVPDREPEVL